jgi:hypothetical protein
VRRPTREDTDFAANVVTILVGLGMAIGWIASWPLSTALTVAHVLAVMIGAPLLAWGFVGSERMLAPAIRALMTRLRHEIETRLQARQAAQTVVTKDGYEESVEKVPTLAPLRTDQVPAKRRPATPAFGYLRLPTDIGAMRVNVPDWFTPSVQAFAQMPALASVGEQLRNLDIERSKSIQESLNAAISVPRIDATVWRTPDFGSFIRNLG